MAHPTLHIQRFATHGSPNRTNTIVFNVFTVFLMFHVFHVVSVLQVFLAFLVFFFPSFQSFPLTAFLASVAGARSTAFPEVRFMRCAVH